MRLVDLDNSWGAGILQDWYIHSVNPDDIPQWTDEHIEELCKDFYVIPKETTKYDIDCNLDRLKELADADKEGRCLVLPCKVGDVLYKPTRTFVSSFKVAFIEVSMCNCLFIHTNLISGINMTGEIFKEDDIGKSVFLTEEEAEKALEELK